MARHIGALGTLVLAMCVPVLLAGCSESIGASAVSPVTSPQELSAGPSASPRAPAPSDSTRREPANVANPAASQVVAKRPDEVLLASGTALQVRPVSTAPTGALDIPADSDRAGWWDGSSKIGEPHGSTVLVGHVDSFRKGIGKFAELLQAQPGQVVTVRAAGLTQRFTIVRADLVPKAALSSTSDLFDVRGEPRLVLITCGGAYDARLGGYQDNMVVVARPVA